ncbi:hypothetical protein KIN20_033514 [Parelaphostrongylus tenuis]|uniref:Uncharacterized protein n=1 Tax=Parelaphostrongylus tenuis TaxID=148309 RepID=A0AAD5R8T7_PARTN|nr:hypothetical protein KIN20_033514 [Parelaphostrongylus tenuis]
MSKHMKLVVKVAWNEEIRCVREGYERHCAFLESNHNQRCALPPITTTNNESSSNKVIGSYRVDSVPYQMQRRPQCPHHPARVTTTIHTDISLNNHPHDLRTWQRFKRYHSPSGPILTPTRR